MIRTYRDFADADAQNAIWYYALMSARVRLLGEARVFNGRRWYEPPLDKRWCLLAYLAFTQTWISREKLAFLFWSNIPEDQAMVNLRQLLSRTKELPFVVRIEIEPKRMRWLVDTDVQEFQQAISLQNLPQAVGAHHGEFLQGLMPHGASEFANWLEEERQNIYETWRGAVLALAEVLEGSGRNAEAVELLKRLCHAGSFDEEAIRRYLLSLHKSGQTKKALNVYQGFYEKLQSEYCGEPEATTLQLIDAIRSEDLLKKAVPDAFVHIRRHAPFEALKNNLPASTTLFVGREREKAKLKNLFTDPSRRLITLVGMGGVGKTRLALEVARAQPGRFRDGIFFVPLAPLKSPAYVPAAVASALNFTLYGGRDPKEQILDYLAGKELLLVLDNFEHLLAATPFVSEALATSSQLMVLATSRVPLHLYGEQEVEVLPLSLPDGDAYVEDLTEHEAVQLFVDRAQTVRDDFTVTPHTLITVGAICARLDSLPLAIELAAARIKVFSPQTLLERLGDGLSLLKGGPQDLPARQQTLRGTFDWSYKLLKEEERALFRCLGVFAGDFSEDAANAVWTDINGVSIEVTEWLAVLHDKSLLRIKEETNAGPRFTMLATLRAFALTKLAECAEAEIAQRAHASYFLEFAEKAEQGLRGANQLTWLNTLKREHNNLRAALAWGKEQDQGQLTLRLVSALSWFWYYSGHADEGWSYLAEALALPGAEMRNAVRAKALRAAGRLAKLKGDVTTSRAFLEEGLAISREVGDKEGIAHALHYLALMAVDIEDYKTARSHYEQSLETFRELSKPWGIAWTLNNFGELLRILGDDSVARTLIEEAVAIRRSLGEKSGVAQSLMNLGLLARQRGDHPLASDHFREALIIHRELGTSMGVAWAYVNLGKVARFEGNYTEAQTHFEKSREIFRELDDKRSLGVVLKNLGDVAEIRGDYSSAGALHKESLQIWSAFNHKRYITYSLEALGRLAVMSNQQKRAARLLGATSKLRDVIGAVPPPSVFAENKRVLADLRAQLGATAFEVAWQGGREMSLEQAIELALERKAGIDISP